MARRSDIDWEAVEREYRAGKRSLRDIGQEFGVSEGGIRKKAKEFEWERDLSEKIDAKAEALVRKSEVRSEVRSEANLANEREIIEANAKVVADAVIAERKDVARA